jgi:YD repeat-containing protein
MLRGNKLVATTYDSNGNLLRKTAQATGATTVYTSDAENRLTRIDLPDGGFAVYRYDGLGRRIEKHVNGDLTRYLYDNEDILLEFNGQDRDGQDRERLIPGGHAAIGWGAARNPGYHSRKVASQSPFNTRVRICSSRCAPRGVQAICCFLQKRLLIT